MVVAVVADTTGAVDSAVVGEAVVGEAVVRGGLDEGGCDDPGPLVVADEGAVVAVTAATDVVVDAVPLDVVTDPLAVVVAGTRVEDFARFDTAMLPFRPSLHPVATTSITATMT